MSTQKQDTPKLDAFTVRLPTPEKMKIDQMAGQSGLTTAVFVRCLIQEALLQRNKKRPTEIETTLMLVLLETFYTVGLIADCHDGNIKSVAKAKAQAIFDNFYQD